MASPAYYHQRHSSSNWYKGNLYQLLWFCILTLLSFLYPLLFSESYAITCPWLCICKNKERWDMEWKKDKFKTQVDWILCLDGNVSGVSLLGSHCCLWQRSIRYNPTAECTSSICVFIWLWIWLDWVSERNWNGWAHWNTNNFFTFQTQ